MSMPSLFVRCHVGHADLPLEKVTAVKGFDLSLGVIDVPRERFGLKVDSVAVKIINAQGAALNVPAKKAGNIWVATIPFSHFETSGVALKGVTVILGGRDEQGVARFWTAGSGDLEILDHDGSVAPGEDYQSLHWYDSAPLNPERGAVAPIDGVAKVWSGSAWIDLGGGGGGAGATVLTIEGGKLVKDGVEIATFADLLALVRSGGVVLMGTVGAQKDALFYPLYCEDNAIRFDATGTLGGSINNKSYTMQPTASGAIRITEGSTSTLVRDFELRELRDLVDLKTIDLNMDGMIYPVAQTFHDEARDNQAAVRAFTIPARVLRRVAFANALVVRGASSDSGTWDRVSKLVWMSGHEQLDSETATMPIGASASYGLFGGFAWDTTVDVEFRFLKPDNTQANVRIALVSVDASEGYSVELSNGTVSHAFAPIFTVKGASRRGVSADAASELMASVGSVKDLATNATQSQIIAKLNEILRQFKKGV